MYLADGVGAHPDLLERVGPHTTGVGCLYLKDLANIDVEVLEELVRTSYETVSAGTFGAARPRRRVGRRLTGGRRMPRHPLARASP